jgi:HAD superfamily hydrolase (TIGR01490 family)
MSEGKVAAFFDFDNTLLAADSAALGFRAMWDQKLVSAGFLLKLILANQLFKRDLLSAERIAVMCLRYYRGRNLQYYIDSAGDFYRQWLRPALSPAVVAKVEEHRQQGHLLVLLSASVDYYLQPAVADLGFDSLLCTRLEIDDSGRCTGRALGPIVVGAAKKHAAEEYARSAHVDLAASYAYADQISDAPLLEAVGHPVAVRPKRALRRLALARGWTIIDGQ